jgi:hypothetical protein
MCKTQPGGPSDDTYDLAQAQQHVLWQLQRQGPAKKKAHTPSANPRRLLCLVPLQGGGVVWARGGGYHRSLLVRLPRGRLEQGLGGL